MKFYKRRGFVCSFVGNDDYEGGENQSNFAQQLRNNKRLQYGEENQDPLL